MIEQETFKRHLVGRDGFQWWIGQVVDESAWIKNTPAKPESNTDNLEGIGARFKVRIMGYHTAEKNALPDEQLPWATVMYPTTAGGGERFQETAFLPQGTFVFGFFLDGDNAQQPVIMGVMGWNALNEVMQNVPNTIFKPFSGYPAGQKIPVSGEKKIGSSGESLSQEESLAVASSDPNTPAASSTTPPVTGQTLPQSTPSTNDGGSPINDTRTTSAQGNEAKDKASESSQGAGSQDSVPDPVQATKNCEPIPVTTMQKQIRNAIQDVERLRKSIYDISSGYSGDIAELQGKINKALQKASKWIAASMKRAYNWVMKQSLTVINLVTKEVLAWIPLDKRTLGEEALNQAADLIVCGFKNIINLLLSNIGEFLEETVLTVINAVDCFVENFVGGFIGAATSIIAGVATAIQDAIGAIADAAMGPLSIASDILSMMDEIFNFLSCEFDPECSTLTEWSILGGQSMFGASDIQAVIDTANSLYDNVMDIPGDLTEAITSVGDIDVQGIIDGAVDCITDAIECGPPGVELFSQSGMEHQANLVIGDVGEIIGVDILSFGVGYDQDTTASVTSECGQGRGAVIVPNVAPPPLAPGETPISWVTTADGENPYEGAGGGGAGAGGAGGAETPSINSPTTTIRGDVNEGSPQICNIEVISGDLESIQPGRSGIDSCGGPTVVNIDDECITVDTPFEETQSDVPFTFVNGCSREGQITDYTIMDPGAGYLPAADGSLGGDGRVWANPNDTTVQRSPEEGRSTGVWEVPVPPGWDIKVEPGDTVRLPSGTTVITEPNEEEIIGGMPHIITSSGTFTAPDPRDFDVSRGEYPSSGSGSYPVILSLCEVIIKDAGLNYKEGDEIVIIPDMGAEAVPKLDRFGRVIGVKVIQPGEGFRNYPKLYIESNTGYNAELIPKFCIDRIGVERIQEVGKEKVLNVVNCVGRRPANLTTPCRSCNDTSMVW